MTTCGQALVTLLERWGAQTAFGIPGTHTLEIYRGLSRSSIRHVTPRHEQGAAFMADGWARVSGRPGVCLLVSGPGLTNAITPIAQAYQDSIPLLIVSGVVPEAQRGRGQIHDLPDQHALMRTVTAFSHVVDDPAQLPAVLERADAVFSSSRPRPVHVQIPDDVLLAPDGGAAGAILRPPPPPPRAAAADVVAAARRLAGARAPLILLGGGAQDAGQSALEIARRVGAPIGLTLNGRGAVDHDDPLCLGSALSFPPVDDLLREADVTLLAGAQLSSDLELWGLDRPFTPRGLIRVDIDETQLTNHYDPEITLHGDAAATLSALADVLAGEIATPDPDRVEAAVRRVREARESMRWPAILSRFADVVAALDAALPADRIVAGDLTQPVYAANHSLPMHRPRSWMMPFGYGSLGCALPMAIGAKLAAPDRPVLALAGDAGVLFTIQELATARDLGLALPIVVYDNAGYGEIREAMDEAGVEHLGTDIATHDLPTIARGFGCHGLRIGSAAELEGAVRDALAATGPTLIELRPATGSDTM